MLNGTLRPSRRASAACWYAPDPASRDFSTIGGNIATNAGGLCCVKYGVTRESVLGAHGGAGRRRASSRLGGRDGQARRRATTCSSLLVGSEGTLGVVTEATLRLRPRPAEPLTLARRSSPPSWPPGGRSQAMGRARITPVAAGADRPRDACRRSRTGGALDLDLEAAALLLFAVRPARAAARTEEIADRRRAAARRPAPTLVVAAEDEAEGRMLMEVRRLCFHGARAPGRDAARGRRRAPRRVPELLARIEAIAARDRARDRHLRPRRRRQHAPDDRLRPGLDAGASAGARAASGRSSRRRSTSAGRSPASTASGRSSCPWLEREIGARCRRLSRRIKARVRPRSGILNPGKAL